MASNGKSFNNKFMCIGQLVQKLIGRHACQHTHTQTQHREFTVIFFTNEKDEKRCAQHQLFTLYCSLHHVTVHAL
jgi:hypothetical protein